MTDRGSEGRGFHSCGFHLVIRKLWKEASTAQLECEPLLGKLIRARRGQGSCFRFILSCKGPEKIIWYSSYSGSFNSFLELVSSSEQNLEVYKLQGEKKVHTQMCYCDWTVLVSKISFPKFCFRKKKNATQSKMEIKPPVLGHVTQGANWGAWQRMGHAISEETEPFQCLWNFIHYFWRVNELLFLTDWN